MSRDDNVNRLLANLNALEPQDRGYGDQNPSHSSSHHEEDLSIFANTEFFDFDVGRSTDLSVVDEMLMSQEKHVQEKQYNRHQKPQLPPSAAASSSSSSSSAAQNNPGPSTTTDARQLLSDSASTGFAASANRQLLSDPLGFPLDQFSIAEGLPTAHQSPAMYPYSEPGQSSPHTNPIGASRPNLTPTRSAAGGTNGGINYQNFRPRQIETVQQVSNPLTPTSSIPVTPGGDSLQSGEKKRKSSSSVKSEDELSPDGGNRVAAEEDKRRRNTAASARFRIKKKLREQEMERSTRELQEKVEDLENKVVQLEMENRWLKNLVVEKNEARNTTSLLDMKNQVLADARAEDKK